MRKRRIRRRRDEQDRVFIVDLGRGPYYDHWLDGRLEVVGRPDRDRSRGSG